MVTVILESIIDYRRTIIDYIGVLIEVVAFEMP